MSVKVSVIVPIYNVKKYLERCLKSLINQTLKDIEIILVDDGSTDGSGSTAKLFAELHSEKVIYLKKKNGGLSDARNYGLTFATGEYVGFIDSDDYVEPDMFEKLYCSSENGGKKIIECNFIWEYSDKIKKDLVYSYRSKRDYLVNGRVEAWNKIYKLEWLKATNVVFPSGLLYEDLNFFFKLVPFLKGIEEVAVVSDILVHYVQNESSITNLKTRQLSHIVLIYEDIFDFYKKLGIYEEYFNELEYKFCRNLLVSFLIKVLKVKDKNIKYKLLDLFYLKINNYFPSWKKNLYLRRISVVNIYLKIMNPVVYRTLYMITI